MAGKTRVSVKTKKLRATAIVRGGAGTATRTVGLLGGILTYAVDAGIIESNPAHGIRKPKDNVRKRRLSEAEYRIPGQMLHSSRARSPRQSPKRSMTGHDVFVLIPQKARLIGVYDSRVAFGQSRGQARVRDRLSRRQDPWPRRVE
jgi:hypothetical protein